MNQIAPLTERRKADRIEMIRQVRALCESLGATVTDDNEFAGPHELRLEIAHKGGAVIWVDFNGKSCQPDVHVACWNIRSDSPACFADSFGDINQSHHRKSQFVVRGLDNLLFRLGDDLEALNDGSAYSPERTAAFAVEYAHRFNQPV
jgi:hypothetical protein